MAVVVSAHDVIVRVDALGEGLGAFARNVPNSTFCSDDQIARVSFMDGADRERFIATLSVPVAAIARVGASSKVVDVAWLERGVHSGVEAAWMRGEVGGPLVVPVRWTPGELQHRTWDEVKEHLEYLGVEGNIEVYRDKRTGEKLYAGRTRSPLSPSQTDAIAKFRSASGTALNPVLSKILARESLGFFERRRRSAGAEVLHQILAIDPEDASAHWLLGLIARSEEKHTVALEHFRSAYGSRPDHPDIGREYAGQCLTLGHGAEAVRVARELHRRFPDDAGLHSNFALALLVGGDLDEALAAAESALGRDPSDAVTKNVHDLVRRVKSGQTKRPTRI